MYSIETTYKDANGTEKTLIVYDDAALDQRIKVVDPVLELEDNSAGSLEFTVYPTNEAYGNVDETENDPLAHMTSTIRVYMVPPLGPSGSSGTKYEKEEIWEGRPLSIEKDFYNGKRFYCEGAFSYLNDIDQPNKEYTADKILTEGFQNNRSISGGNLEFIDFIKAVLTEYNKRAADNRKFDIDGVYVNPIRIPLNYTFKGCLADLDAIIAASGSNDRDIYQTMEGLTGYRSRGYGKLENTPTDDLAENDLYYATDMECYYVFNGISWKRTHVMDYVGKYYTYGPDPKSTGLVRKVWTEVTDQIHITCGISRTTGGENTKQTISSLVENFGGHIKVRTISGKRCLYYTAKIYPEDEFIGASATKVAQSVDFGKNLIDLTKKKDGSEFFTVLLPVGAEISPEHPETIESMCNNVISDFSCAIAPLHNDLSLDTRIQPFDATQQFAFSNDGRTVSSGTPSFRRSFSSYLDPGYTYYLFTSAKNQENYTAPKQGATDDEKAREERAKEIQNNTYMYFLYDSGPNRPNIFDASGGVSRGYYVSPDHQMYSGETFGQNERAVYKNDRLIAMKQLSYADTVTTLEGEEMHVPNSGLSGGYSLYFNCSQEYAFARVTSGENINTNEVLPDGEITDEYIATHELIYPKLYKSPYSDIERTPLKVRRVDDSLIWWAGCTKLGGADRSDIDPHKLSVGNDRYGTDDWDFYLEQNDFLKVLGYTNSGRSSWHVPWFDWQRGLWYGKNDTNNRWAFFTGYSGHHIARVIVDPGKTYYLNTRVTNQGFPKSSYKEVANETQLPETAPIHAIYKVDETNYGDTRFAAYEDGGFTYPFGAGADKDYSHMNDSGYMQGGRDYYDVIAYAIVERRPVYNRNGTGPEWRWQILEQKLANRSQCATVFNMEEIKIPLPIPPDRVDPTKDTSDNRLRFYDDEGNAIPNSVNDKVHMELWFACDQCYINGNGEYDSSGNLIGYKPEVFVEDTGAYGSEEQTINYKDRVTIKPLRPAGVNGGNWPDEYLINQELFDKYGPIVKVAEFENAYTPSQLMVYAQNEIDKMKGEDSFEVSALDLKSCGLSDCDRLRLMQKIKINDSPHGIDAAIVLSKMTLDLMDITKNTYTLGYEANRGISSM